MAVVSNPDSPSPRKLLWLWALIVALVFVLHARCVNFIADDGYIGFRYVQNLLAGRGLVYNPGEFVEGYTNFLWLMVLAIESWCLPGVELIQLAQWSSLGFGVLAILTAVSFSRQVHPGIGALGLLGAVLIAADTSLAAWSTSGLETMMFASLALVAAVSYVRALEAGSGLWRPSLIFALLCMTRPDGLLLFGVTSIHFFVVQLRRERSIPWRASLRWAAPFLILFVPFFLWRFQYYGEPLPNTYHVKAGSPALVKPGVRYVLDFAILGGFYVFVPAVLALLSRRRVLWRDYFALLVASYLAHVIWVGGDGLGFHRFIAHIAPLMYLLVQDGVVALGGWLRPWLARGGPRLGMVAGVVFCVPAILLAARRSEPALGFRDTGAWLEAQCGLSFPGDGTVHDYVWFDNYFVDRQALAARWLQQHVPPDSLVAATPAGSIAAHMELPVLDMLGLNDYHIARTAPDRVGFFRIGHMKGDGAYVLKREPAIVLMGNVCVLPHPLTHEDMAEKLVRKSEHELWNDPRFHEQYQFMRVRLREDGPFQHFMFYARRDLANALSPTGL